MFSTRHTSCFRADDLVTIRMPVAALAFWNEDEAFDKKKKALKLSHLDLYLAVTYPDMHFRVVADGPDPIEDLVTIAIPPTPVLDGKDVKTVTRRSLLWSTLRVVEPAEETANA